MSPPEECRSIVAPPPPIVPRRCVGESVAVVVKGNPMLTVPPSVLASTAPRASCGSKRLTLPPEVRSAMRQLPRRSARMSPPEVTASIAPSSF